MKKEGSLPAGVSLKAGKNSSWRPEYKKFRVKSSIKSFRDLEVYKQTNLLSVEVFQYELPATIKNHKKLSDEINRLDELSQNIPRMIAESYGDKFTSITGALDKLESAMQIITKIVTKIDFLVASIENQEIKEILNKWLKRYQTQRVKIHNLKNAWDRAFTPKVQKGEI